MEVSEGASSIFFFYSLWLVKMYVRGLLNIYVILCISLCISTHENDLLAMFNLFWVTVSYTLAYSFFTQVIVPLFGD